MYQMFLMLQYVGIIILIIELLYIANQWKSRPQMLLMIFVISTLINFVGYLFELQSTNKETALIAVKFIYLGKPFISLSMILFVLEYCKVKINKVITYILVCIHVGIMFLVFTCEHHSLYYSKIEYTYEGVFPHLVFKHGIIYNLYTVLMFFYTVCILVVCFKRYFKMDDVIEKRQITYLLEMSAVTMAGYIAFLAKLTYGYDTTILGYLISTILFLLSIFRYNLFDTLSLAKDTVIDNFADGLIVLDRSDKLIYYNVPAKTIYPQLSSNEYMVAVYDIKKHCEDSQKIYLNKSIYSVAGRDIIHNKNLCGKMYVISDVTDSYNYTVRLQRDVSEKTKEIVKIQHSVIASFANMIEARDGITGLHIKRTSAYVEIIVKELQKSSDYKDILTDEYASKIIDAASLHDIGKISIPDYILKKPGKLTDEEFDVIKTHPGVGADIIDETLTEVEGNEYLCIARDMAHYHHEKWNGTGYPCGLKGEEIPLCARIMAIADVYDALRSKRSYKEGFSKEKSRNIILESSGSHFDPKIVDAFMANIQEIEGV